MNAPRWRKDRCVEWLISRWLDCVPPDRTKSWLHRLDQEISVDRAAATLHLWRSMPDDRFGTWLLDEAEPQQQSLAIQLFRDLVRSIEEFAQSDVVIEAVAIQMRDGHSLRTVLCQALASLLGGRSP